MACGLETAEAFNNLGLALSDDGLPLQSPLAQRDVKLGVQEERANARTLQHEGDIASYEARHPARFDAVAL